MAKSKFKTKPPLKVDVEIAPSIIKEGGPTKPPLVVDVKIAPSTVKEGFATKKRLGGEPEPEPISEPTEPEPPGPE